MKDTLQIGQIDATENYGRFSHYGLRSTPGMILFKDGSVQWQSVGAMSKADLKQKVESALH